MAKDIAIIGMSVEVPQARDIHAFWDIVRTGRTLTRPFPAQRRADVEEYVAYQRQSAVGDWGTDRVEFYPGAYLDHIDRFDPEFFGMTPRQAAVTDPHQRLILRTMYLALEDAGYTGARVAGTRTGVFVGFAANPGSSYLEYCARIDPGLTQLGLTGNIPTMLANRLSYLLDLHGPSLVVDSACSASLVAVHLAANALLAGDCDLAVAAGTRVVMMPVKHPNTRIGIESSDGMTRTFGEAADGTGYGEGSGVVVLKRLDRALADGDQVYAVIKGSAVNHDGRSDSMTAPDPAAQARLLLAAWADAGVAPDSIGYLEAHGTATRIGDPIELDGLTRAFRAHTDAVRGCAIGTVKANAGHLFEGSGVLGLIKAALTLRHRQLPPLAGRTTLNPLLDFDTGPVYVPETAEPWTAGDAPRRAAVSAFGLGGTNAHVVLEEHVEPPRPAGPGPWLFTLSARGEPALRRLIGRYLDLLGAGLAPGVTVRDVCYSANRSRSGHPHRIAFPVRDLADLRAGLAAAAEGGPTGDPGELGRAYLAGAEADLLAPYAGQGARTVWLPGYSFEEQRCWIDFPADWAATGRGGVAATRHPVTHDVGFALAGPAPDATGAAAGASVLALVDPATGAEPVLAAALPQAAFVRLGAADGFRLDEADLERVADLAIEGDYLHVVHALAFESGPVRDAAGLDVRLHKNLSSLLMLAKGLMSAGARLTLTVLTRRAVAAVAAEPGVVAENGALVGLARSIGREYPYLTVRVVDTDVDVPAERLRDELLCTDPGVHLLRGGYRYHERFAELPEIATEPERRPYLRPGGTYLVTGGTGAIGLAAARHFAAVEPGINLVLTSRSGLPERERWEAVEADGPGSAVAGRIRAVREIEALGATVTVVAADAGDERAIAAVLERIRERHGRLDGVVHAAGVAGISPIVDYDVAEFESVLRGKLRGAFLLDRLTAGDRPDFVLHLSSVAATMPALGQAAYAAANFYLDNLATANPDPRCHVLAIDWVSWREAGMAVEHNVNDDLSFKSIPTAQGVALLDDGLRSTRRRFLAGEINYGNELTHAILVAPVVLEPAIREKLAAGLAESEARSRLAVQRTRAAIEAVDVELDGRPDGRYSDLERLVGRCVAHAFGVPRVDVEADLRDMGADSITALTVAANISACIEQPFDAVDLLTERTVAGIARFIDDTYGLPAAAQPQLAAG
ncbi:SDR family NAD(P)-dependent oxidoreductase [Dactylosporangium sp. CA-092794]|uniref:SDR family NAD(P)-dependent oxidoreductase n=1 Tax=Dactylosporangium sp. CA-092794 TaxID=3239929 RepID=UPI003D936082